MWAIDLECHWRNEGAGFTDTLDTAPASEGFFEELAYLAIRVREVACGGVTMIGGDDQPPPHRQTLDKGPEVIAAKLIGGVTGQRVEAMART